MYKYDAQGKDEGLRSKGGGNAECEMGLHPAISSFYNISVEMGGVTLKSQPKHVQCGQWKKKLFFGIGSRTRPDGKLDSK